MSRETEAATACQPDPGEGSPGDSADWRRKRAEKAELLARFREMSTDLTPIPVGTVVDYHGSLTPGRYVVEAHEAPREGVPADAYPDGVAYVLWKQGVPRKFGLREHSVVQARRKSLTVAEPEFKVRYPDIKVQLTGQDGNIFMIMGAVRCALRDGGAGSQDIEEFTNEVMGTDSYDHALQAVMRWVRVR